MDQRTDGIHHVTAASASPGTGLELPPRLDGDRTFPEERPPPIAAGPVAEAD